MDSPKEFEIKQPRWLLVFSLILGIIGIIAIAVAVILTMLGKIEIEDAGGGILAGACALLFLASIGIYSYCHDTFAFREGFFICKRIFHKTKRVPVDMIYIAVRCRKILAFKDENFECILRVTDAYPILESDSFKKVLEFYEITLTSSQDLIN